jgi:hypothetical protein
LLLPMILETNANGGLEIPASILNAGPRARYRVEQEGSVVRIVPEAPDNEALTPEMRAQRFLAWVEQLPKREGPPIPADALRRENMYD